VGEHVTLQVLADSWTLVHLKVPSLIPVLPFLLYFDTFLIRSCWPMDGI